MRDINIQKLADEIMRESAKDGEPVTMEEALEMAEMEVKAKGLNNYVQSSVEKKNRQPRTKKVDEEKAKVIEIIAKALIDNGYNATITNVDKTIDFNDCTITLTRHRKGK